MVMQTSSMPSTEAAFSQMESMFFFTRGSPPVMRTLDIPREAAAFTAMMVSSSVRISSCAFLQMPSSGTQ